MAENEHPPILVARVAEAFKRRAWDDLERLYHPEALSQVIAGEREVTTRAETMAVLRRSTSDMVYDVNGDDVREVDDHAALIVGSIRYRTKHGFAIHQRSWLLTFRDGLVYRVIVFNDADEALRAYGRLGVEMGLPTPFDLALSRDADPAAS